MRSRIAYTIGWLAILVFAVSIAVYLPRPADQGVRIFKRDLQFAFMMESGKHELELLSIYPHDSNPNRKLMALVESAAREEVENIKEACKIKNAGGPLSCSLLGLEEPFVATCHGDVGWNPDADRLFAAIQTRNLMTIRDVLASGVDANTCGRGDFRPLMIAAIVGDPAVVRLLLQAGADANLKSSNGRNSLSYARAYGHRKVSDARHRNGPG